MYIEFIAFKIITYCKIIHFLILTSTWLINFNLKMTSNVHSDTKSHSVVLKESRGSSKDGCKYTVDFKRRTQTKIQCNNSSFSSLKNFFKVINLVLIDHNKYRQ